MKKITACIPLILLTASLAFAQDAGSVEMADKMRSEGKIYVVIAVMAIIFTGIVVYLFTLDRKIGKLEKELKAKNK